MLINLKPRSERSLTASQIIRRIQRETGVGAGHLALHAAGAGPHHRFDGEPHAVPVRPAEPQARGFRHLGAAPDGQPAAPARDRRRHHRHAGQGPGDVHQARSRRRRSLRHHRRLGQQRAVRCLRPAHRLDGLRPVQPVPRDLRGRAVDGPLHRLARQPLPARRRRQAGADVGHRHLRGTHLAAAPGSARPVPGHHHLLQPGAGLCARPGGRRHPGGEA